MKPIIAITAGDIAGVGPEVILRALEDPVTVSICHPVLIGDPEIFRQAGAVFGIPAPLQEYAAAIPKIELFRAAVVSAGLKARFSVSIHRVQGLSQHHVVESVGKRVTRLFSIWIMQSIWHNIRRSMPL